MDAIAKLLALHPAERSKVRLRKKQRKPYGHRHRRPQRSREELLEYLVRNGIKTTRALTRQRQTDDPTVGDYRRKKAFGSWSEAVKAAFGPPPPFSKPIPTPEYILNCMLQMRLHTRAAWEQARRQNPTITPSRYWITRLYGSFDNLKFAAEKRSGEMVMRRVLLLARRLGRPPSLGECQANGIDTRPAVFVCGGKQGMLDVIRFALRKDSGNG